jgi:hypothetical protein
MVFKDDDCGFLAWQTTHAGGFVLNTTRTPRPDYLVLHRATCPHLTRPDSEVQWTKNYIKICSTQVDDLVGWLADRVPGRPRLTPCATCKPTTRATLG